MDTEAPADPTRPPERGRGPRHARRKGRRRPTARRDTGASTGGTGEAVAYSGPERRNGDLLVYTGPERRAGGDRRTGSDRRESPETGRFRLDVRAAATHVRTFISAIALSVIAAVGSYAGTYRAMEFLFTPAVVAPVAATHVPAPSGAEQNPVHAPGPASPPEAL